MSGGTTEVHKDDDYLATGTHDGVTVDDSELVTNGDMELDSDWSDTGSLASNTRSSEQAHGGTYSRKLTLDGSGSWGGCLQTLSNLVVGRMYKVVAWVRGSDLQGGNFYLNLAGDLTSVSYSNGSWVQLSAYKKATSTSHNFRVYLHPTSALNAGVSFYVDDASVQCVGTPTLIDRDIQFKSNGIRADLYIENTTQDLNSLVATVTEDEITTDDDIAWNYGDTYKIYKTSEKGQVISTEWVDLSRGWKTRKKELIGGWREKDLDIDRNNPGGVFGPGQPEKDHS